jgi:hypothetical protein
MDSATCTTQLIEATTAADRATRVAGSCAGSTGMWFEAPASASVAAVPTTKYFHRQLNAPAARGGPL